VHNSVDVIHHFLLLNTKISQMSSVAFSDGLAGLFEKSTAGEPENQSTAKNAQNSFTASHIFHYLSPLKTTNKLYTASSTSELTGYILELYIIIAGVGWLVNAKRLSSSRWPKNTGVLTAGESKCRRQVLTEPTGLLYNNYTTSR